MNKETLILFEQFLTVRHRNYREINTEINDIKRELTPLKQKIANLHIDKSILWQTFQKRSQQLQHRWEELKIIKLQQKELAIQFTPRYYAIIDGVLSKPLVSKNEARRLTGLPPDMGHDEETVSEPGCEAHGGVPRPSKQCSLCEEEKPLTEFYKSASAPSGYHSQCVPCYVLTIAAFKKRQRDKKAAAKKKPQLN